MRGILTIWVSCSLLLASVPAVTSTTVLAPTTTVTTTAATTTSTSTTTAATTTSTNTTSAATTASTSTTSAANNTSTNTTSGTTTTIPTTESTTKGSETISTISKSTIIDTGSSTVSTTKSSSNETGPTTVSTTKSPSNETGPTTVSTTNSPSNETGPTTVSTTKSPSNETGPTTVSTTESPSNDTGSTIPNTAEPTNSETGSTIKSSTAAMRECSAKPCGSMPCLQLYEDYVCRCPLNSIYTGTGCSSGESLHSQLQLTETAFNSTPSSKEYTDLYKKVVAEFNKSVANFSNEFMGTVILEMSLVSRRNARNAVNVLAKASNLFVAGSVKREEVEKQMADYFQANAEVVYKAVSVCDLGWFCDPVSTTCVSDDNITAVCQCRDGFYSSMLSYSSCRECSPDCTAANGKHCVQDIPPRCVCQAGHKMKDNKCVKCDFGYSGEDCADNFQLILVIVGAVLGGVALILLGTIIGLSVKFSRGKGDNESTQLISKDDRRSPPASPVPGSIFPKVTLKTDLGEVNRGVNVYEENEEFTRSLPQRDYDENPWYEMERKKRGY